MEREDEEAEPREITFAEFKAREQARIAKKKEHGLNKKHRFYCRPWLPADEYARLRERLVAGSDYAASHDVDALDHKPSTYRLRTKRK